MKSLLTILGFLMLTAGLLKGDLTELLPETLLNAAGEEVKRESLEGKVIGIYFSAEWCPPCRNFTPSLVQFRNYHSEKFEIVFVSSDRTADAMWAYMKNYNMDFLTLPFGSPDARKLAEKFGVRGIPHLAVVAPDGSVLAQNGRTDVAQNPGGALQKWLASADMSVSTPAKQIPQGLNRQRVR